MARPTGVKASGDNRVGGVLGAGMTSGFSSIVVIVVGGEHQIVWDDDQVSTVIGAVAVADHTLACDACGDRHVPVLVGTVVGGSTVCPRTNSPWSGHQGLSKVWAGLNESIWKGLHTLAGPDDCAIGRHTLCGLDGPGDGHRAVAEPPAVTGSGGGGGI